MDWMASDGDRGFDIVVEPVPRLFDRVKLASGVRFVSHSSATRIFPVLFCLAVGACEGSFSALDPAGPSAERIATLWWVMLGGAAAIFVGVMAAALYALAPRRRPWTLSESAMLGIGGVVFPLVTLVTLLVFSLRTGESLIDRSSAAWRVDATARQWAWEFVHLDAPGGALTTEGEMHVPAGRPVEVHVRSTDVIHSFWSPRLAGKIDAIPGKTNVIILRADEPGQYGGLCAEYCGELHAHMGFVVHAHPPDELAAMLAEAVAR